MSSYKAYLKRKENASPYADKAVCMLCKHCETVRLNRYCHGFYGTKKIPSKRHWDIKPSYCTQYWAKEKEDNAISEGDSL
jgi:hypothetical protein